MARAIRTGSVSFGLVNVPVGLYSATEDHDVHFHQFEKGTTARVRNQRVNEKTGDEVAYKDVVKRAELSHGGYVMVPAVPLNVEPLSGLPTAGVTRQVEQMYAGPPGQLGARGQKVVRDRHALDDDHLRKVVRVVAERPGADPTLSELGVVQEHLAR